ncbi:MAG: PP2C family protein-serine/threonine phosphatase [Desulfobacterales bacterium]|nr:PP2C family protein-serine/threonine phosphatase [Desulfobacterales bacterium]
MKTTLDSSFQKIHLTELYGRNVGANVLGFLIIALLNLFTPVEFFKIQRAFLLSGGWMVILSFYPVVICIGIGFQYIVQRPITQVINRMRQGLEIDDALAEKAYRRILNLPFIIGLVNFAMWIVLTSLLGTFFVIFRDAPPQISFFVAFRGFMVGYISAIISFFLTEAYSRRRLVRTFFPAGKLATIPGTIKFSILRRIRVLYGVGTLAPMIILVGTLAFILWEMDLVTISAADFGREFLIFSIILCVIFIFVGGRLNVLSGKSIIQPITDMMVLVRRVRRGHFKQKVRVVSNDELGVLGDGLNEMTEGLIERDEIRQSLVLAQEVQQTLLPRQNPQLEKLDVAATIVYCDETGGDYYDFLETNESHPGDFTVTIGDVSGHGIPAALMMASARAFLRQRSILPGTLVDIVSDVNQQMARDFEETGGFMTLFYLTIDTPNNCLYWVRAGHDPAILYDPESEAFEELRGAGIALGVDMDGHYAQYQKENLKRGQIILLGSDGLWEARNPKGDMFGKAPVHQIVGKLAQSSAKEILTACFHEFNVFLGDCAPEDDVTLVVIKITKD